MKHIIILITAVFLTFISGQALAQSNTIIQPLGIGDPIPDEVWNVPLSVVNHPDGKEIITLADYKDKLIIIDFWATWCVPCIKSLYKLDTLQGQFADDLVVIPTTYEDAEDAATFFKKRGWQLPTATLETTLKSYFPHQSIPHQVWVKDGNVLSIVGPEYANADMVTKVIDGQEVDFDNKIEVEFDKNKPIFLDGNGGDGSNMLYQSVISGRLNVRVSGISSPTSNQILAYNQTVEQLYTTAVQGQGSLYLNPLTYKRYVIYEVNDTLTNRINPETIVQSKDESLINQWAEDNIYCYNLVLPKESGTVDVSNKMLQDLNDFFRSHLNLRVTYEDREVMALALVKNHNYRDISTIGGDSRLKWYSDIKKLSITNKPIYSFISYMRGILEYRTQNNLPPYPYPIVNETGIEENVDLTVNADFMDIESVRKGLSKYGLDLVEKTSTVKMIVFKYADQQDTDGVED